jgi:hypothetical protein
MKSDSGRRLARLEGGPYDYLDEFIHGVICIDVVITSHQRIHRAEYEG